MKLFLLLLGAFFLPSLLLTAWGWDEPLKEGDAIRWIKASILVDFLISFCLYCFITLFKTQL